MTGADGFLARSLALHGSDKSIASARDGFNAVIAAPFAERLAKLRNVDREIRFLHEGIRPYPVHKIIFFNELSMALDQDQQNIDGLAGHRNQFSIPKKETLRSVQPKGSEFPPNVFWSIHGVEMRI